MCLAERIRARAESLRGLDLDWWVEGLRDVLDEFVDVPRGAYVLGSVGPCAGPRPQRPHAHPAR